MRTRVQIDLSLKLVASDLIKVENPSPSPASSTTSSFPFAFDRLSKDPVVQMSRPKRATKAPSRFDDFEEDPSPVKARRASSASQQGMRQPSASSSPLSSLPPSPEAGPANSSPFRPASPQVDHSPLPSTSTSNRPSEIKIKLPVLTPAPRKRPNEEEDDSKPSKTPGKKSVSKTKAPRIVDSDEDDDAATAVMVHKTDADYGKGKGKGKAVESVKREPKQTAASLKDAPAVRLKPPTTKQHTTPSLPKMHVKKPPVSSHGGGTPQQKDGTSTAPGTPSQNKSAESTSNATPLAEPPRKKPKISHLAPGGVGAGSGSPAPISALAQKLKPSNMSMKMPKPEPKKDAAASDGLKTLKINKIPKPEEPAKPLVTFEQRQAALDKAKKDLKEELAAQEMKAFDLLEQKMGMEEFEDPFRKYIQKVHVEDGEANGKDPGVAPLPRLTTYGSVFSLFPRSEPK